MKKSIVTLVSSVLLSSAVSAQVNSEEFIDDVLILASNFAQPAADAAPYQASAGWFSSAEALQKWDFRLSLHGNALFVPDDKQNFQLQNQDLSLLQMGEVSSAELPTGFGGATNIFFSGEVNFLNPISGEMESQEVRFKGFDGIAMSQIPHAFAQVAVGVGVGTEITLRAMPKTTIDGVAASTYGVGAKHNLTQYFGEPGNFQFAAAIAYSKLQVEYEYDTIEVERYLSMNSVAVDADLWMAEFIGSKKWGFFELFGAAGAMNSNFHYEMGGSGVALGLVNSKMDILEGGQTQFKGDLGFNLHFGRFRLSTMATVGEFFNGNVGLHVRI